MTYNIAFPYFPEEDVKEIVRQIEKLLYGEGLLTMGENVKSFEEEFATFMGAKYGIATNSCTSALEIVLKSLGVGEGDEVIVPCQTFVATGSAVAICGAKPVFAEVDNNFSLDIDDVKKKITRKTKAVIVVHFAGLIQENIFELKEFLDSKEIYLIEDCAHAHGAKIGDTFAGNIGIAGCFSFYSTKILTTGEGGMITTNDEELYKKASSLRSRGLDVEKDFEIYANLGRNCRFTEIQAILGRFQLKRLEEFVAYRNKLAKIYLEELYDLKEKGILRFQEYSKNVRHSYWRFVVFLRKGINRERVKRTLREKGIMADNPYAPLLHLQPVFKKLYNIKEGMLPKSEELAQTHICLPMHLKISEEDARFIAKALRNVLKEEVS